jgi:hypothetical protein
MADKKKQALTQTCEECRRRQKWYFLTMGVASVVLYYVSATDVDFWRTLLTCVPAMAIIFVVHVRRLQSTGWWANWAFHKIIAMVFIFYYSYRLMDFGPQYFDLWGLSMYFYAYHVTDDLEL